MQRAAGGCSRSVKTARKYALAACLSAAFLTLPTPTVFFFHAGCGGVHAPVQAPPLPIDGAAGFAARAAAPHAHYEARAGAFHDAGACLLCQTLLQSMSGAALGAAQAAPRGEGASERMRGLAAASPRRDARPAFLSRAPPLPG